MNREASKHKILRRGEEGREGDTLSEREVKRLKTGEERSRKGDKRRGNTRKGDEMKCKEQKRR